MKNLAILILILLVSAQYTQTEARQDKKPKNLIIMIGDGMGTNYVNSLVISNKDNAFKRFHSIGFSVTCSADKLITDSAAGATALSTGHRTDNLNVGVDSGERPLKNIMEAAQERGKATGVVVTSSVTHATPAGFVAHVGDRGQETEIAKQFAEAGLEVAIGGGQDFFLPESKKGVRKDNVDLTERLKERGYKVILSLEDLKKNDNSSRFFALLDKTSLPSATDRNYSLDELVKSAIDRLSKDSDGFVMMIEGSQIDWGGHANNTKQVQGELSDFNKAVNYCLDFAAKDKNTLVVVTADHETGGLSITGGEKDGSNMSFTFNTKGHTAGAVGVFASGPGEELFRGYLNNFEIGQNFFKLLEK